jgi:hypothetical protein
MLFALFHATFWKLFRWPSALVGWKKENQAIMQILNIQLIYIFLFTAFLCFFFTEDLYRTALGRAFLVGMAIFWLGRALEQFIFLRMKHWLIHVLTVLFITGVLIFLLPVFS